MRHLATKTKYLAEKSLAGRTLTGLVRGGKDASFHLELPVRLFWLFMLLPIRLFAFHASDTNGLMVAKPVTCLPN